MHIGYTCQQNERLNIACRMVEVLCWFQLFILSIWRMIVHVRVKQPRKLWVNLSEPNYYKTQQVMSWIYNLWDTLANQSEH